MSRIEYEHKLQSSILMSFNAVLSYMRYIIIPSSKAYFDDVSITKFIVEEQSILQICIFLVAKARKDACHC